MKKRINILDDLTINKIAAGEVVERPSSVVKELLENAIDAASTKIIIEIADGGKKLIRITDNGGGIPSSEVEKAFLRHATSKIKELDDLYDLYSLGFRGEALASISSVAKIELITKTKDEMIGTKVIVEGGKIISKEPVGTTNGTTIIVKDIFYNTPARQKFLKSSQAEVMNIGDIVNKLVIGNPNIQFKYINNNKTILNTPGDNKLVNSIRSVYGKDTTENLIPIEFESENVKLSGYIGNNNIYRSNRGYQHIYINKRLVKCKIILDAISEGYKSIIPINKHAICFLNLTINPSKIDVNIHPTKLEVKFEDEKQIYIQLRDYIKNKLLNSSLLGKYETKYESIKEDLFISNLKSNNFLNSIDKPINIDCKEKQEIQIKEENIEFDTKVKIDKKNDNKEGSIKLKEIEKDLYIINESINEQNTFSFADLVNLDTEEKNQNLKQNESSNIEKISNEKVQKVEKKEEKVKFSFREYIIIGSIFNTYIVLQKGSSMYLVDQHAAHERILYEQYMDKFYNQNINIQILLDPSVVEVSNVDIIKVENNLDLFMKFGFELDIFGNNHIMVRGVPTIFGIPESEKFILEIIDNIDEINNNYELKGEKFASMACKSAIKANDKIYTIEIDSLLMQLEKCENPFTCPHGRPITVELSKIEIEKMFKRIM